jgi:hypothetical protein
LPLREDFARWRDDPITQLVFGALDKAALEQKAMWDAASWGGGRVRADELKDMLQELRVRADCYAALSAMTIEDVATWLGIEVDGK